jgi:hypothetical protein
VRRTHSLLFLVGVKLNALVAIGGSSPPGLDPSSAPFSSFAMPTVQMPMPDIPEMSYAHNEPDAYGQPDVYGQSDAYDPDAYGQSDTSEHPHPSEHLFPSEHPHPLEYPNTFQQPHASQQLLDALHHVLESGPYHSEPSDAWVPEVPGLSDEAEVDPTSEPIYMPVPEILAPVSPKPSRKPSPLKRFASFLGFGRKSNARRL